MAGLAYLDSSALVKLVIAERESPSLQVEILERSGLVSSWLAAAELQRAVRRTGRRALLSRVDELFGAVYFIDLTQALLMTAGELAPPELRTLDAIHVAAALSVEDPSLDFLTYDTRQAAAARQNGLRVLSPGR